MPQTIKKLFSILLVLFSLFLFACGSVEDNGENYGDILDSPDGLILTEEEHQFGWGRSECIMCHNLNNIHTVDRTGLGIDVEAIQEQTFEEGEASCPTCHGTNGVE